MKTVFAFGIVLVLFMQSAVWAKIGGGDITFHVPGAANVLYSHDDHVGKFGLKCKQCHHLIYTTVAGHLKATMAEMQNGKSCGTCHNGKNAFDVRNNCAKCHKG